VGYAITQLVLHVHVTLEVSIAFFVGSAVGAAVMAVLLVQRMRGTVPDSAASIVEAIKHEALEI
jgi:hypothetical protein